MSSLGRIVKCALGAVSVVLACPLFAVTAVPGSISVDVGTSQIIKLSNVAGTVAVSNSNRTLMTVTKIDARTYRVYGVEAGSGVLSFDDRRGTSKVYFSVVGQAASALSGRLLASNCFQCHGTNGTGGFDKLAGKRADEIFNELKEFSTGKEDADGIMAAHAMGFSEDQLKSIANYFSTVRNVGKK